MIQIYLLFLPLIHWLVTCRLSSLSYVIIVFFIEYEFVCCKRVILKNMVLGSCLSQKLLVMLYICNLFTSEMTYLIIIIILLFKK